MPAQDVKELFGLQVNVTEKNVEGEESKKLIDFADEVQPKDNSTKDRQKQR